MIHTKDPVLQRMIEEASWIDPSDTKTLWQDPEGKTPVTEVGQPVGRIDAKSPGKAHVISRGGPIYCGAEGEKEQA